MTQVQASAVRYINIDINCELKIDYTSIDIDIELVYRPSRIVISDIEHHFDELYEKRIVY